jgi:hypothetical protein
MSAFSLGTPQLDIGDIYRIECNDCQLVTNHQLKAIHRVYGSNNVRQIRDSRHRNEFIIPYKGHARVEDVSDEVFYYLWVCMGCNFATLEVRYGVNVKRSQWYWDSYLYPERLSTQLSPKAFDSVSAQVARVYHEVVGAFNSNLPVFCTMGLRALLEAVCVDKGLGTGNLKSKIDALGGLLSPDIAGRLHHIRFMGNEAAHEVVSPQRDKLLLAIEIIEDIINFFYELDLKTQRLSR